MASSTTRRGSASRKRLVVSLMPCSSFWNGWPIHTDVASQGKYLSELQAITLGVRIDGDPRKFDDGEFRPVSNEDSLPCDRGERACPRGLRDRASHAGPDRRRHDHHDGRDRRSLFCVTFSLGAETLRFRTMDKADFRNADDGLPLGFRPCAGKCVEPDHFNTVPFIKGNKLCRDSVLVKRTVL